MQVMSFKYFYAPNEFLEYERAEGGSSIVWRNSSGNPVFSFSKLSKRWYNIEASQELFSHIIPDVEEQYQLSQHTPEATQMINEQLHVCDGQTYIRREDAGTIRWSGSAIDYTATYRKMDGLWFRSDIRGSVLNCFLEQHYQEQKKAEPTPPQLRLVSRGQSTSTGKEVIEIHAYNHSRGIWEKLPIDASIVSGCYWTLEEILQRYV